MKKLIYLIVLIVVLGLIVSGCIPVVPPAEQNELDKAKPTCTTIQSGNLVDSAGNVITTGYDKWGYNYQAYMFNGFYWNNQRPVVPWTKETLEAAGKSTTWLVMKWSDTWLSNKDCNGDDNLDRGYACDPINANSSACEGAWLTNHQWGSYKGECWSFLGDWVLEFDYLGNPYIHDMTITDDSCESFSGTGSATWYSQTWTVTGEVDGDNVIMTIDYDASEYIVNITGIIAEDGTMSGDWASNTGQAGTWISTMGTALCEWDYFVKIVYPPEGVVDVDGDGFDDNTGGSIIWGSYVRIQQVSNDPCAGEEGKIFAVEPAGFGAYK